jgi:hypothetical protein
MQKGGKIMKISGSVKPKTNIKNDLCKIKKRRLPYFGEKIISFRILNNYARLNGTILPVTLMLLVLSVSASGFTEANKMRSDRT